MKIMTRLLVTTIRRHTPYTEPSGFIYLIDHEKEHVLQRSLMDEPAYRELDTNPRGGMRGSRGISIRQDQIALANAAVIYRYDPEWNILGIISHPSMVAIHDILFIENSLWATSARNDLVFQFDLEGKLLNYYYLREPSPANEALRWHPPRLLHAQQIIQGGLEFRDPRTHEEETYDWAHVNSVCALADGSILVSMGLVLGIKFAALLRIKSYLFKAGKWSVILAFNRELSSLFGMKPRMHSDLIVQPAQGRSAVIRLPPQGDHQLVLSLKGVTVPSHSLVTLHDQTNIYLNTTTGEVVHFTRDGEVISVSKVTNGFLRGATQLDERTLVLGSKQEIIEFDLSTLKVKSTYKITSEAHESVYDIKILPPHYTTPPASFAEHFKEQVGFYGEDLPNHGYSISSARQPQGGNRSKKIRVPHDLT